MSENKSVAGVLEYISRFRPNLIENVLGADDALIHNYDDLVEEVTGLFLPFDYFEFLQLMGFGTPIAFADDASMEIENLYEYYRVLSSEGARRAANHTIIATGGYNLEQLALERTPIDDQGNTESKRVFYATGGNLQHVIADSFLNFLYRRAFEACALTDFPISATYHGDAAKFVLPQIDDDATQFKWHKEWFSDSVALCMTAPNKEMALCARQAPDRSPWLRIAGNNKQQIFSLGEQICNRTNLELEKWWS